MCEQELLRLSRVSWALLKLLVSTCETLDALSIFHLSILSFCQFCAPYVVSLYYTSHHFLHNNLAFGARGNFLRAKAGGTK